MDPGIPDPIPRKCSKPFRFAHHKMTMSSPPKQCFRQFPSVHWQNAKKQTRLLTRNQKQDNYSTKDKPKCSKMRIIRVKQ